MAESRGLPELREVLTRLAGRADLPLTEEEIAKAAESLYFGSPAEVGSTNDPMQWIALAALEDHQFDPASPAGADLPHTVFGHHIRNPEDLTISQGNLNALRKEQWGEWAGPGWSQGDLDKLEGDRLAGEMSPGDAQYHQWIRDHQYLRDILTRRLDPTSETPKDKLAMAKAWSTMPDPNSFDIEQKNLDDALYWYNKGKGATHYFGRPHGEGLLDALLPGFRNNVPGMDWGTANFRRYATDEGIAAAASNNDYLLGSAVNHFFSPWEETMNRQTMQNMDQRGYGGDNTLFNNPVVRPVWDFFANALNSNSVDAWDYGAQRKTAKQALTGSPLVPHKPGQEPTREEKIAAIRDYRKALKASDNMSGTDYHFAQTGKNPSYGGAQLMTLGSSLLGDPSVFLTAGLGGARAGIGNFARAFLGELGQEAAETGAFQGLGAIFPLGEGLSVPHVKDWTNPDARTDIPKEDNVARAERLKQEEYQRRVATEKLTEMNKNLPSPKSPVFAR